MQNARSDMEVEMGGRKVTKRVAFAGEAIKLGSAVFLCCGTTVFAAGSLADEKVGIAVENIRNGYRVEIKNGEVKEDDA